MMVVRVLEFSESQRRRGVQKEWKKAKRKAAFLKRNERKQAKKVFVDKFSSMVLIKQEAEEMMTDAVDPQEDAVVGGQAENIFRRKFSKSSNSSFS